MSYNQLVTIALLKQRANLWVDGMSLVRPVRFFFNLTHIDKAKINNTQYP